MRYQIQCTKNTLGDAQVKKIQEAKQQKENKENDELSQKIKESNKTSIRFHYIL